MHDHFELFWFLTYGACFLQACSLCGNSDDSDDRRLLSFLAESVTLNSEFKGSLAPLLEAELKTYLDSELQSLSCTKPDIEVSITQRTEVNNLGAVFGCSGLDKENVISAIELLDGAPLPAPAPVPSPTPPYVAPTGGLLADPDRMTFTP